MIARTIVLDRMVEQYLKKNANICRCKAAGGKLETGAQIISIHLLMMEDGHCSLSNNLSKNAIRPFTVTAETACPMERDCENELSKLK